MGASWYSAFTIFGYAVITKEKYPFNVIHEMLQQIAMEDPITINDIQKEIHSRMEGNTREEMEEMEKHYGVVVIGFKPSDNMLENCTLADKLAIFIERIKGILQENKIEFGPPQFHSGIY
jgi:hypothetical protein